MNKITCKEVGIYIYIGSQILSCVPFFIVITFLFDLELLSSQVDGPQN